MVPKTARQRRAPAPYHSPMHAAAELGDLASLSALLAAGIDPNAFSSRGLTALHAAAKSGQLACVNALLADPRTDVNAKGEKGHSPLMGASWSGEVECMEALLAHPGIDINARNYWGRTAAWYAAVQEHEAAVDVLLARNADFSMPMLASERGDVESFSLLVIPEAIRTRIVAKIEEKGGDPSALGAWLQPPAEPDPIARLIQAAFTGDLEATKTLVEQLGINAADGWGHTALMAAAFQNAEGCPEVVRFLIAQPGVQLDARDHFNRTAYYWAAATNSRESLGMLAAAGADIALVDRASRRAEFALVENLYAPDLDTVKLIKNERRKRAQVEREARAASGEGKERTAEPRKSSAGNGKAKAPQGVKPAANKPPTRMPGPALKRRPARPASSGDDSATDSDAPTPAPKKRPAPTPSFPTPAAKRPALPTPPNTAPTGPRPPVGPRAPVAPPRPGSLEQAITSLLPLARTRDAEHLRLHAEAARLRNLLRDRDARIAQLEGERKELEEKLEERDRLFAELRGRAEGVKRKLMELAGHKAAEGGSAAGGSKAADG
ncbi:ankyrin repeat-containing domain protein [Hyaloraphidium curvatum]|nr:ankyrin repeat-containing domain protein [Hyaloraphidium curvatum]